MTTTDPVPSASLRKSSVVDANHPGNRAPKKTELSLKSRLHSKAQPIESVDQLLRAVYDGTFKRSTLRRSELNAMKGAPSLRESEKIELLDWASSDRSLERTRQLMSLSVKLKSPTISNQIREFVREVLENHPAFGTVSIGDALRNPELPIGDSVVRVLTSYKSLSFSKPPEMMKGRNLKKCIENAVLCLLLWYWMRNKISVEEILRILQENLWTNIASKYRTETDKIRMLISVRNPAAASIVFAILEEQALEQYLRADAANRSKERAIASARDSEKKLAEVQVKLTESRNDICRLEMELERQKQTYANERAHLKDDYEQMRGQVLRRLRDELALLDEGLHALKRNPPKVHVMVDHAERVIEGLKSEAERLMGDG